MRNHLRRRDDPTDAPAGHGMGFGQAANHDAAFGHARQCGEAVVFTVEHQAFIHLIHHDPEVMGVGQVGDGLQFLRVKDHAGGVVRVGEENRPGTWRNRRAERLRIQAKARLRRTRHAHQRCTAGLERGFVGDVHRVEHQHFITGLQQAQRADEQRVLCTGHDDDVFGSHRPRQGVAVACCDGVAQWGAARDFGVVGITVAQCTDGRVGNKGRRGKIRIADAEDDDVLTLAGGVERGVVDVPGGDALPCNSLNKGGKPHARASRSRRKSANPFAHKGVDAVNIVQTEQSFNGYVCGVSFIERTGRSQCFTHLGATVGSARGHQVTVTVL